MDEKTRAMCRRRVVSALNDMLNDPAIMPNADCPDLVVMVSEVEFGRSLRRICVDFRGFWKDPERAETAHDRYMKAAELEGRDGYDDLQDVTIFPQAWKILEEELQKRLGLSYRPTILAMKFFEGRDG